MRKLNIEKETSLEIEKAVSFENGIIFFSNYNENYGSKAIINNGKIYTKWTEITEISEILKSISSRKTSTFKIIDTLKDITYYLLLSYMLYNMFFKSNLIISIFLLIFRTLSIISASITVISLMPQINENNIKKFHSAEHMSINAYKKLGRAPSLDEIKHFSRLSNLCGTNLYSEKCAYFLLMFAATFIPNIYIMWLTVMIIRSEKLIDLLSILGFFNIFQLLTTAKPTDVELNVAIAGLKTWIKIESALNLSKKKAICISKTFTR